ncbi:MAG TPA: ATP synthase F1 subunit delta [Terriglobia bacterium]|nr:ATP synthase F1 subunit delta [Terriglobia bacterium]
MPTVVANRYARALADVIASTGNYRQVLSELEDFDAAYRESIELRAVCDTPAVTMAQKLTVLEALAGKLGSSHVTLNFLRVLMSHYRMPLLGEILQAFRNVAYARLGIVRVKVSSASGLSPGERELLQARFNELTEQQSELEFHLDGDLIGGLVAQIGSTVYDGSIRGHLDRIREKLLA